MDENHREQAVNDAPGKAVIGSRGHFSVLQRLSEELERAQGKISPVPILLIMIGGIFLAEVIAMLLVHSNRQLPYYAQVLLDAAIMTAIVFPLLYYLSFRPLREYIERQHQTQVGFRLAFDHLKELELIVNQSPTVALLRSASAGWPVEFVSANIKQFGYSADDFIEGGRTYLDLIHPLDRERVTEEVNQFTLDGLSEFEQEYRICAATGEVHWLNDHVWVRRDAAGAVTHFQGVLLDVTERKLSEEALIRVNQFLDRMFSSVHVSIAIFDRDFNFLRVNHAYAQADEKEPGFFIGKNHFDLYPDSENEAIFRAVVETGEPFVAYARPFRSIEHPERGVRYGDWTLQPIRNAAGEVEALVSSSLNITEKKHTEDELRKAYDELELHVQERTEELRIANFELESEIAERKQAESALRKNEAILRGILDATLESIWLFSPEGIILLGNQTALLRMRRPPEEVINKRFSQLMPPEIAQSRQACLNQVVESGSSVELVDERNGIIFHHNFYPIKDADGGVIQIVTFSSDITKQKQDEEKLRQLNRTLKALSNINQVMLRAANEKDYLESVCRIVAEDCGHAMVWIGFAEDDEEKSVRPMAYYGFEAGYLETLKISWADTERGRGPTGLAIRTGKTNRCRNMLTDPKFAPWREQALKRGYASSIVLPLVVEARTFGAINIYSREADAFSDDEEKLLAELAGDLAYGIQTIRLREAQALADVRLRESEARFRSVLDSSRDVIYRLNLQTGRYEYISPSVEAMMGYSVDEIMALDTQASLNLIHPDDLATMQATLAHVTEIGRGELEYRQRTKNGDYCWLSNNVSITKNGDGQPLYRNGNIRDVTERKQVEDELRRLNEELTSFNRAMVGRELRMIELKKEVNNYCRQAGQSPRYPVDFENEALSAKS